MAWVISWKRQGWPFWEAARQVRPAAPRATRVYLARGATAGAERTEAVRQSDFAHAPG